MIHRQHFNSFPRWTGGTISLIIGGGTNAEEEDPDSERMDSPENPVYGHLYPAVYLLVLPASISQPIGDSAFNLWLALPARFGGQAGTWLYSTLFNLRIYELGYPGRIPLYPCSAVQLTGYIFPGGIPVLSAKLFAGTRSVSCCLYMLYGDCFATTGLTGAVDIAPALPYSSR